VKRAVESTAEDRGGLGQGPGAVQTILVVDDDSAICNALYFLREAAGYAVLAAPDGLAALEVGARNRPDLVVIDLHMPGLAERR
jgi:CheY-like chemotaxis protein